MAVCLRWGLAALATESITIHIAHCDHLSYKDISLLLRTLPRSDDFGQMLLVTVQVLNELVSLVVLEPGQGRLVLKFGVLREIRFILVLQAGNTLSARERPDREIRYTQAKFAHNPVALFGALRELVPPFSRVCGRHSWCHNHEGSRFLLDFLPVVCWRALPGGRRQRSLPARALLHLVIA